MKGGNMHPKSFQDFVNFGKILKVGYVISIPFN